MKPDQLLNFINGLLPDSEPRFDANETAVVFRRLEAIKARTYDVKYPNLKARQFIPVDTDVDPAADTIVYGQFDAYGMARIVSNYATDLPRVDVIGREFRTPVKSIADSYGYSVVDLRRGRLAGQNLEARRAEMARRAIETAIDRIAAYGDADTGLPGFLTNANVPETALTNGTWISSNRTAVQMLADLHALVDASVAAGKDVFVPDTLLLPTREFARIAQTFMSTDNTTTVLRAFLNENPYIKNVDYWSALDAVPVAGGSTRKLAVCYTRSPEVLTLEIPQEFEQFPPQAKGLAFEIPCHARIGGTVIRYPVAVRYGTGI